MIEIQKSIDRVEQGGSMNRIAIHPTKLTYNRNRQNGVTVSNFGAFRCNCGERQMELLGCRSNLSLNSPEVLFVIGLFENIRYPDIFVFG